MTDGTPTGDLVTDGATAYEATPDGRAEPIPAGETIHVKPLGASYEDFASAQREANDALIQRGYAGVENTGQRVAPVTVPLVNVVQGSVSMVSAKFALDCQRLLTLALAYVPNDDQTLRDDIHAALRVRVVQ